MSIFPTDVRYDPIRRMAIAPAYAIGYNSRIAGGTQVHPTRESMLLAIAAGASGDGARMSDLLREVVLLQDRNPLSPTFGAWPWYAEEPLTSMEAPDRNWADFIGALIADLLIAHGAMLAEDLRTAAEGALNDAAWAIFRRDTPPSYTNIAIMGAGVAAGAGRILGQPLLQRYGAARLAAIEAMHDADGGFREFNSPQYTMVALEELERTLRIAGDPATLACAGRLHRHVWTCIAEHWHPPTGQWGGPWCRTYRDRTWPELAAILTVKTGIEVRPAGCPVMAPPPWARLGPPCPADLLTWFSAVPREGREIRRRFAAAADPAHEVVGTTWMDGLAVLGSCSRSGTWVQTRGVLAAWPAGTGRPAVLRQRLLKDGRDCAAGFLRCRQAADRILAVLVPAVDQGDWHCRLDRPANGTYRLSSLVWRWEVDADDATVDQEGPATWRLRSGSVSAVIRSAPDGSWSGREPEWRSGAGSGAAWVEAVLHEGRPLDWRPEDEIGSGIGCSLDLGRTAGERAAISRESDGWSCIGIPGRIIGMGPMAARWPGFG